MTEQTSIDTFRAIKADGTLTRMQLRAFQSICYFDSFGRTATGGELNSHLRSSSMHKRISELHAAGVIECSGVRGCRVTGRKSKAWKPTGRKPHETLMGMAKIRRKETMASLRDQVARLESSCGVLNRENGRLAELNRRLVSRNLDLHNQVDTKQKQVDDQPTQIRLFT